MKRKVLHRYRQTLVRGSTKVDINVIYFVIDPIETSRSIKTNHYGVVVNVKGKHRGGVNACTSRKPFTLAKNKIHSYFEAIEDEAKERAFAIGIDGMEFDATVSWWNPVEGRGYVMIEALDQRFPLYASNIKGRRSWWPEAACVSYERDQQVRVQFHEPHFLSGLTPGTFNAEQFASQDRSRMSFTCDEDGQVNCGLFGGGK